MTTVEGSVVFLVFKFEAEFKMTERDRCCRLQDYKTPFLRITCKYQNENLEISDNKA